MSGVEPFGVYLHVPFCAHRCDYCAFATWTDQGHLVEDYMAAVASDVARARRGGMLPATSVFVGGGTPSLVPAQLLCEVLSLIDLRAGAEVTVECNPETVDLELMERYVGAGVNRISLGVQSMVPDVLSSLGREHDPRSVFEAVDAARSAGIRSLNVDLIYGAAGETADQWRASLEGAVALGVDHVSAYALTVEPGTPLAADPSRHPDDDEQADKYIVAAEVLGAAGLQCYEISNWARPGHRCAHNLLYWSQADYAGFGCAAHSHRGGRRWWNVRTPWRYVDLIREGSSPEAGSEQLDGEAARLEGLQLAVRTSGGVPDDALSSEDRSALDGLVEARGGQLVLTPHGRLLANEVAVRLR